LANTELLAQQASKNLDESSGIWIRMAKSFLYPDAARGMRLRLRLLGVVLAIFAIVIFASAISSIWSPQCGTVLDLPRCL